MKTCLYTAVAGLVTLGLLSGAARAAEKDKTGEPRLKQREQGAVKKVEGLLDELNIPEDKQPQVRQILQTHRQAVANWNRENGERRKALQAEVRDARRNGEAEAAKAAEAKLRELLGRLREIWQNTRKQLADVLTPEQLERIEKAVGRQPGREAMLLRAIPGLDLTEAQKAAIEKILVPARAEAEKAKDPKEKAAIMQQAWRKVRDEVLTAEQRGRLEAARRGRQMLPAFGDLNLTADQRARIDAIRKETMEQLAKAETPAAKRQLLRAAHSKVLDEVLTDPQRKQLRQNLRHRLRERTVGGQPKAEAV